MRADSIAVRTGVWFPGGDRLPELGQLARGAELAGVDSVWVAEGQLGRDAFLSLAQIAGETERVALGTGVVNPYTRHPAQLAASFASLDELSAGRVICGVGIGGRHDIERLGFDVSRPLAAAGEMIGALRPLLARETVTQAGRKFDLSDARLGFRPIRSEIPIYLAAAGPKMCALAGEIADGIYLSYGTDAFLDRAIANSEERRPASRVFDICAQILMAVDDEVEAARAKVRPGIGFVLYEPNAEGVLEANGLDPEAAQRIREGLATGGVRGLIAAVDDDIVDSLTIAGAADHCLARLEAAVGRGVTHPTVSLLGDDPRPALEVLAELKKRTGAVAPAAQPQGGPS